MTAVANIDLRKYGRLLAKILPAVIETEEENERMLAEVKKLLKKGDKISPEEEKLFELMTKLIEDFEEKHYPIPEAPPNAVLQMLMTDRGLRPNDMQRIFKSSSVVSGVLSGKRKITKTQAKALSEFFKMPFDLFIQSTDNSSK